MSGVRVALWAHWALGEAAGSGSGGMMDTPGGGNAGRGKRAWPRGRDKWPRNKWLQEEKRWGLFLQTA